MIVACPENAVAKYKKKIVVVPFTNPPGLKAASDPGGFVAELLERMLTLTGKYHMVDAPSNMDSGEAERHPAQILIEGRVLEIKTRSESSGAKVEIELVVKDAFTERVLNNKILFNSSSKGQMPFQYPESSWDLESSVFHKTALGKALMTLMHRSVSHLNQTLSRIPFRAIIISVDNKKLEVVVNAGENNGIKAFEKFYVYSVNLNYTDPITHQDLGEKTDRQGIIKVKNILDNYSLAEIIVGNDFMDGFVVRPLRNDPQRDKKKSWLELYGNLVNP